MLKPTRLACVIALPLLICGFQSYSTPPMQPVATQCQPPPQPAAWFMAEHEPNLTQRMLNELSASPMPTTRTDRPGGLSGLRQRSLNSEVKKSDRGGCVNI